MQESIEERVIKYYDSVTEQNKFVKDVCHAYVCVAMERDKLKEKLEGFAGLTSEAQTPGVTGAEVSKTVLGTVDLKQLKEK